MQMRKIKVLAIDQTAVNEEERKKYTLLAENYPVELTLLIPKKWKENNRPIVFNNHETQPYKLIAGRVVFPGYSQRSFYLSGLVKAMASRPDIIHILQAPFSFFALQIILLKNLFCPGSRIIIRSSVNTLDLPYSFSRLYYAIQKYVLKYSDYGQVPNSEAKDLLQSEKSDLPVKVIPHARDENFFFKFKTNDLRAHLNLDGFTVGYIGRFLPEKGLIGLVKAVSAFSDANLLLIGSGPLKEEILGEAEELNFRHRVRIVDTICLQDVPRYLNCMDCFVLPSLTTRGWKESFGRVLIEAFACEVPVIGSSSGEIPAVIGDGGLVYPEGDVLELQNRLRLLKEDEKFRRETGLRGRERFLKNFTIKRVAEHFFEMYAFLVPELVSGTGN